MYKYFLFYLFFFASSSTYAQNAEWRHIHQGNRAFVKGDYKTAEFEYRAALKLNPQSARAAFRCIFSTKKHASSFGAITSGRSR